MTILVLGELKRLFHLHKGKSVSSNYFDVHRKGYWNPSLYTLEKIIDELKIELYSFLLAIENDLEIETMIGTAKGCMHCKNEIFKIVLYIMDEKKVSRLHLARLMNKDLSAVCRYFRDNDYFSVSLLYLEDICKALEIELSVLVGKCDEFFYNGH